MPSASMAKTAAMHMRSRHKLQIGGQDIKTHGIILQRDVTASTCPLSFYLYLLFYKTRTRDPELAPGWEEEGSICYIPLYEQTAAAAEKANYSCFYHYPHLPLGCQVKVNTARLKEQPTASLLATVSSILLLRCILASAGASHLIQSSSFVTEQTLS